MEIEIDEDLYERLSDVANGMEVSVQELAERAIIQFLNTEDEDVPLLGDDD